MVPQHIWQNITTNIRNADPAAVDIFMSIRFLINGIELDKTTNTKINIE